MGDDSPRKRLNAAVYRWSTVRSELEWAWWHIGAALRGGQAWWKPASRDLSSAISNLIEAARISAVLVSRHIREDSDDH